ncbi:hypothetical protein [Bacillus sp. FJAT-29814]|uniref:hypothetical protein n=1 Tax=Bacillus sp. FJAT-29814 TaxID=1729688 RepID=UPI000830743B|nr:hypothetical protein [Bacillus sp. FJAT-29814]
MLKKRLVALIVIASFLTSWILPKAYAEAEFQPEKFPYKAMQIQVMPEFDYPEDWASREVPSLLVGMYGTITNKTGQDYDGKIELAVPAKEKGFDAFLVAEFPEENKPEVQRPYDVDLEKGIISWKPGKPIKNNQEYQFVIEYYTQSIDVKDQKSFTYEFTNKAETEQLDVIFYAPMNAKEIKLEPKAQENSKNEYGEELYFYQYKNVKIGEPLKYSFSYKKDGTESTMEAISKAQPPNDKNHEGVSGSATDQILGDNSKDGGKSPIIGIGGASIIGIAIIIAGAFVYLGLKANSQSQAKMSKQNKQPQKRQGSTTTQKVNKTVSNEAKKELRKKLLTGKIDQETYDEEMKKLI